jgi:hypothetical protein
MTSPQLSPGGQWWWTGDAWVAATDHPDGRAALAALQTPEPVSVAAPSPPAAAVEPVVAQPLIADPEPVAAAPAPAPSIPEWAPAPVVQPFPAQAPTWSTNAAPVQQGRSPLASAALVVGGIFGVLVLIAIAIPVIVNVKNGGHRPGITNGISQATRVAVQSDMMQSVSSEVTYFGEHGTYAGTAELQQAGFHASPGITATVLHADTVRFCIRYSNAETTAWYDSRTQLLSGRACS